MSSFAWLIFHVGLLFVLQTPPGAREVAPPDVDLTGCPALNGPQIRKIVVVELRNDAAQGRIVARCRRAEVELRLVVPGREGPVRSRTLDLSVTPAVAQSRLVALAMAELMQAPPAVPIPAAPAETRPTPPPSPPTPPVAPPPRRHVRLFLLGEVREPRQVGPLLGGGLGLDGDVRSRQGWQVEVLFGHGNRALTTGQGLTDDVTASAAWLVRGGYAGWRMGAGLGLRGGWGQLRGLPSNGASDEGHTVTGLVGGPCALITLTPPSLGRLRLRGSIQGGYQLSPLRGTVEGGNTLAWGGPWIGGTVGVGMDL